MNIENAFPVLNLLCKTPPRSGQRQDSFDPGWNCDPQSLIMALALQQLNVEVCQMRGVLYAVLEQLKLADGCKKTVIKPHYYCFAEIDGSPCIIDPSFSLSDFTDSRWQGWNPLGIVAPLIGDSDMPCRFNSLTEPSNSELFSEYTKGGAGRLLWYCGEETSGSLDEYLAIKESAVMDYLKSELQDNAELCFRKVPPFIAEVMAGNVTMPSDASQRSAWEFVLNF